MRNVQLNIEHSTLSITVTVEGRLFQPPARRGAIPVPIPKQGKTMFSP